MTPQLAMTGPLVIPLAPLPVRRHAWFFLLPRLPLALFVARGSQTQNTKTRKPSALLSRPSIWLASL